MTVAATKIEQEIRKLPTKDLVELYECLIDVIHNREQIEGLDASFCREIQHRIVSIDSGKEIGVEAFRALEQM